MSSNEIKDLNKIIEEKNNKINLLIEEIARLKNESQLSLEALQLFYENILSAFPGSIYWMDLKNRFLGCNTAYAEKAELNSRKEIVGKTYADLPWSDQAETLNKLNEVVCDTGVLYTAEEYDIASNGMKIFASHKIPLKNETDKVIGILGWDEDITSQKKMEAALRKMKEQAESATEILNECITNIRADFSIPLTGIVMLSKKLAHVLHEPHQHSAELIYLCTQQLFNLLNGIFALVDSKKFSDNDIIEQTFSLNQCIQDIVNLLKPLFLLKNIEFKLEIDEFLTKDFIFDKVKLHHILLNLLIAIIQNTSTLAIAVRINLLHTDKVYSQLRFSIEQIHREVDTISFEQLAKTDANLSVAQKYISLLGGEILKEDKQEGSVYSFVLSLKIDVNDNKIA